MNTPSQSFTIAALASALTLAIVFVLIYANSANLAAAALGTGATGILTVLTIGLLDLRRTRGHQ
ncbi:MAG: hypothetical protein H0U69_03590 [Trueperaceae bacterium]|nr:hypothetical protein [Trueperaceae bacterium]